MNNDELDFKEILRRLHVWHQELEPRLRAPEHAQAHGQAVQLKRQIEAALACLEFCQKHELHPARLKKAFVLPPVRDFGGEYRVMEDLDSGDCRDWLDPLMDDKREPLYAQAGDVVV